MGCLCSTESHEIGADIEKKLSIIVALLTIMLIVICLYVTSVFTNVI